MADIDALIAQMTLEEKCTMVVGETRWVVKGCERLQIPEWCLSDGPVGVRGRATGPGLLIPSPSAVAATWDPSLVEEIGAALGVEAKDRKVDVLLAPTVNLHRSPRGGRHFESYSEDPELSSEIAVAYIRGVQSQGVGACVKHLVANDQEFERYTINVEVDERSLREIYLPPFEAAVKEAGVRSVMGAYNFVNGHHACAHPEFLVELLKNEWGFDGFVVSDWEAVKETAAPARHGLDLEMPGPGDFWGEGRLQAAVESGEVDEHLIDDKVRRIIRFLDWAGRIGTPTDHTEQHIERPEHRELARRAATESMVLLRNDRDLLPLAGDGTIALIGPGVAHTSLLGGGSASLEPHRASTVAEAMQARLGDRVIGVATGIDMRRRDLAGDLDRGVGLDEAASLAAQADTAVVVVGSSSEWESEGGDRGSIDLPNQQDELVRRVIAANPNTVVVLNCGAPMSLPWLEDVSAALLAWYPGQEAGNAITDVLVGDAEPAGRMPTTWASDERDTPAFLNYPGEAGVVRYGEGIFVGYRFYDARGVKPMIPFGHGGSYTTFDWGRPSVHGAGADLTVEIPITNTGQRLGSEVVQAYVAPVHAVVARPIKELAGFAKLALAPGETKAACIKLRDRSFARWDPEVHDWVIDPGCYSIILAASAANPRFKLNVVL
ncbi:MAG: glycoside hydrolase family 3 C-terminal domain-containing protein [Acidimicrobiaceae bacterium]|nr:glycoside hydrolase family 3 C-terminal domain-containing protein [Acidimicrobiaceae bacterium]